MNVISAKELRRERRRFEEELRKALQLLEKEDLLDEGEDLLFRLRQKMAEKMNFYLKIK